MEGHQIRRIDRYKLLELITRQRDDYVLLDVRGREEFLKERLPGARQMLIKDFDANAKIELPIDKLIITYSEGPLCPASTIAAKSLQDKGFNVMDYQGSFEDWKDAQFQTERVQ